MISQSDKYHLNVGHFFFFELEEQSNIYKYMGQGGKGHKNLVMTG